MQDNTLFALLQQQISIPVVKMSHLLSADSSFASFCLLLSQEKTMKSLGSLSGKKNNSSRKKFLNLWKNQKGYGLKTPFWHVE